MKIYEKYSKIYENKYLRYLVQPMRSHIEGERELKQQGVFRIELRKCHHETCSGTPVSEHIEHHSKLCAYWKCEQNQLMQRSK